MAPYIPMSTVNRVIALSPGGPPIAPTTKRWTPLYRWTKIAWHRAQAHSLLRLGEFPSPRVNRTPVALPNCTADWLTLKEQLPADSEPRTLLYLHGGGFILGSARSHQGLVTRLMRETKSAHALNVHYRLAPEATFPAWVDDALDAYQYLLERMPAEQIWVAGESAGGNLVLSLLLSIQERGLPMPRSAMVFSPWTDLNASAEEYAQDAQEHPSGPPMDGMVRTPGLISTANMLSRMAGVAKDHPLLSPIYGEYGATMPPLFVTYSEGEALRRDARLLIQRYQEAGLTVKSYSLPKATHAWLLLGMCREAHDTVSVVAEALEEFWAAEHQATNS